MNADTATGMKRPRVANSSNPLDYRETLAHHDAELRMLGGQVKTLQTEVHSGFASINTTLAALNSKFDRFDAVPKIDFHRTVSTVTTLAVLFSMVCGGIIWITTGQFQITTATVERNEARLGKVEGNIYDIREKLGWIARVDDGGKKR